MKLWPWSWPSRRRQFMIGPFAAVVAIPDHDAEIQEARHAREISEQAIDDARVKRDALRDVAQSLRGERPDRFAEQMEESFRSRSRHRP